MHKAILKPFFCLLVLCPLIVNGQLYHGSANFSGTTSYEIDGKYDSLFVFYSDNTDKYIEARFLNSLSDSIAWFIYNPLNNEYQFLRTDTESVSRMDITDNTGYRIIILGDSVADTLRCWVLIDDFSVDIYNSDSVQNEGNWIKTIPTSNKWCHLLRNIMARINSASLNYFNPTTGDQISITGEYPVDRSNWTTNPRYFEGGTNTFIRLDNYWLKVDVENPYWENSWYKLTIADQFGLTRSDSVFNETIEPHADFTYEYIKLGDSLYYPDRYDNYYVFYNNTKYADTSAPALYKFNNLSVNAQVMTWYFGDSLSEASVADSILHTYQLPGRYVPKLVVSSTYEHLMDACTNTLELENNAIIISEASIVQDDATYLPNVFSCPDGENNIFRFINDVSITEFEIAIYNRYGKRVYHFKGNIRDWEGWDGRDKNSDRYVQTGVYYYVVKELEVLPDFETGKEVRLQNYFPSEIVKVDPTGKNKKTSVPSIYRGFVHVYNTE